MNEYYVTIAYYQNHTMYYDYTFFKFDVLNDNTILEMYDHYKKYYPQREEVVIINIIKLDKQ